MIEFTKTTQFSLPQDESPRMEPMMAQQQKIDFSQFTLEQLEQVRKDAEAAIAAQGRIKAIRAEIMDRLKAEGLTLEQVFPPTVETMIVRPERKKRQMPPVAPKYRHPDDASLVWTGRGRMPIWLANEVDKGNALEGFLIL